MIPWRSKEQSGQLDVHFLSTFVLEEYRTDTKMEKTEKWHILAILENGSVMSFSQIRIMLEKDFSLKPSLAALRKNLQRCSNRQQGQALIRVEKIGRNNFYQITEKGKKRRGIIAAKREKAFKDWLDSFFRKDRTKSFQVSPQKPAGYALAKRMAEALSSMKLCDALLSDSSDPNTLNNAAALKMYWQNEASALTPYLTEEAARIADKLSRQFGESVEKLFK